MAALKTPRFNLPQLAVAQAYKEITHNEALIAIDALLHPVIEAQLSTPPTRLGSQDSGLCWLVVSAATGEWQGKENRIACWVDGAWRFVEPNISMSIFDKNQSVRLIFQNNQWTIPQIIADPSGGSVVDAEARATLGQILALLRSSGLVKL